MPLCSAHTPSSAWNVLPSLPTPSGGIFLGLPWAVQMPPLQCRPPHLPLSRWDMPLCVLAPKHSFHMPPSRNFGWFVICHFGSWDSELLRGTESIIFIFVSSVLAPAGIWKILVEFIHLTEWFWEVLKGLNSFQILDKQQKRQHKISKKKFLI